MFRVTQRVAQTSNCFSAHRSRCEAPFQKCFLRARDCLFIIPIGCGANAGQAPAINWRDLVDLRTAATPFSAENARIFVGDAERSEERRVGKECRTRWARYRYKETKARRAQ